MAAAMNNSPSGDEGSTLVKRIAIGLIVLAVLGLGYWGVSQIKLGGGGAPKRQTVKITLPDMPPPPPPPKQEEKKPEPKEDNKPAPQMEQKQAEPVPQAPAQVNMAGAAGDGPSAFGSGGVNRDLPNGPLSTGGQAGGGTGSDRAKYQFYINSTKQLLKDEIERHLQSEEKQLVVSFSLWVKPDGGVDRYELVPTGNEHADQEIKTAFAQMAKSARLPAPKDTPQPLRLRMTLLPLAS
jgi:protein TonB